MNLLQRSGIAVLSVGLTICLIGSAVARGESRPPNIVFILADDLGYGELGSYGQKKIRTPHLDRLADEGIRFTQHYAGSPVCAPSRAVLMTGKHPGHAWVRDNRSVKPEGQFSLPADAVTAARLLKERGYVTGAFGKWGLGGPDKPGRPLKQGFDRFFGYNCQVHAHSFYPQTLWDDEGTTILGNPEIPRRARLPEDADPETSESYKAFAGPVYSADVIAEQALEFVRENRDAPFFLFWPTTVPHLALQVPDDSLAEYLGLWPDPPYQGDHGYVPHFAPRAAYAAMITRMDREIGRLVDLLNELGLDENTIVVFTSDNGPAFEVHGGADPEFFQSAGPLRGYKGSLLEGGIRVPLIVRWKGRISPGGESDLVTGFEDWLPTLVDLADQGGTTTEGKQMAATDGIDGISFAREILGGSQTERPFLYREFPGYGGQQSVRVGDWKLIRQNLIPPKGDKPRLEPTLELYNLASDIAESKDLAADHPEMVAKLRKVMREQRTPSPHFRFSALDDEAGDQNPAH